jgi:hypothetical protein
MPAKRYVMAAVVACANLTADAAQLPYRFDKVAETGAGFTSLDFPALNDLGVVSFSGSAAGNHRVFYGTPFITVPVATPADVAVTGVTTGINNAGQVVYTGRPLTNPNGFSGADGVYRTEPTGTITTIAEPYNTEYLNGGPVVNNSGQVAWTLFSTVAARLYVGDGTGQARSPTQSTGNLFDPHISNAGRTVVISSNMSGRFLVLDDQPIISLANFGNSSPSYTDPDFGTPGFFSVNAADVAHGNRVVFAANWDNLTKGVYLWDNGTISKLAGGSDLFARPAINDLGTVAALLTDGGSTRLSILGPGGEDKLIAVGDPFFGSTVTSLAFVSEGFNNLEQFTFRATLADGRDVIVLAQLPEPGSAWMLVAGAGILLRRRRS